MPDIRHLARRMAQIALILCLGLPATSRGGDPPRTTTDSASLSDLASSFSAAARRAAQRHQVELFPRTLSAGDGLQASAALRILASEIERQLGPAAAGKSERCALPAVLEVRGGRLLLSAPLLDVSGEPLDAIAASIPLTPAVERLLEYGPLEAAGFTLRRVGTLTERVLDAESGDLDGDGTLEIAVLSSERLLVVELVGGRIERIASEPFPEDDTSRPVRDPRGVVTIAEAADGHPATIFARRAGQAHTHEAILARGRLTFRGQRDDVVLAAQRRTSHQAWGLAEFEPGTNWLRADVRLTGSRKGRKRQLVPFYALRAVPGRPQLALLDTTQTLHIYDADLLNRRHSIARCGAGFAVADFLGDEAPEALCSGVDLPSQPDRVRLVEPSEGEVLWTSPLLPGGVRAIATLPDRRGPVAALLFVDDPDSGGTTLWWLRRGY